MVDRAEGTLANIAKERTLEGLTNVEAAEVFTFVDQARSPNTLRTYRHRLDQFALWCIQNGHNPLPASAPTVALFLTEKANGGYRKGSVGAWGSAIGFAHKMAKLPDPTADVLVKTVMAGIRRSDTEPEKQARPMTATILAAVVATARRPRRTKGERRVEGAVEALRRGNREIALFSVMRDALLRVSEAVSMRWSHIEFGDDGCSILRIPKSKTDQEGIGAFQFIGPEATAALLRIKPEEWGDDEPVFTRLRQPVGGELKPLDKATIGQIMRRALAHAGIDPHGYSPHSCRIGMAHDLLAGGADIGALTQAGRWASPVMPARYTKALAAGRGAVAQHYGLAV